MMESLALEAFALARQPPPTYTRAESPVSVRRLVE